MPTSAGAAADFEVTAGAEVVVPVPEGLKVFGSPGAAVVTPEGAWLMPCEGRDDPGQFV